jgi:Ca2+-binding RTX toxin-like protein
MYGDRGDDELVGGGGNDELHGGDDYDLCIGDWAHSYRTRSSNGERWHWSVMTEDRVMSLNMTDAPLIDAWLNADLIVGFGDFFGDLGSTWNHLYTKMIRGGNDMINGDDGNDICIGGLGDDSITGGNGDDVLVGDHMITPSAVLNTTLTSTSSYVPILYHALRSFIPGSSNIIGEAMLVPYYISSYETMDPLSAVHHVSSWQSSTIRHLANIVPGFGELITSGDTSVRPLIIIYGSALSHGDAQYGNDELYGDNGNDIIVGDWLIGQTWNNNHDTLFDDATQRVMILSSSIALRLSTLSLMDHRPKTCYRSSQPNLGYDNSVTQSKVANDIVVGDSGNDISVGDNLLLPSLAPIFYSITQQQFDDEAKAHYLLLAKIEGITAQINQKLFPLTVSKVCFCK